MTLSEQDLSYDSHNGIEKDHRSLSTSGIKFFEGYSLPAEKYSIDHAHSAISAELLRTAKTVWRPEETLEAAELFFPRQKVLITGQPQNGKGTILFGLSDICDLHQWGYLFIDGHHQDTSAKDVSQAIKEAQQRRIPIFFDSFDYLFVKTRKMRSISIDEQEKRTQQIIESLKSVDTPTALTMHDDVWQSHYLNSQLLNQHRSFIDQFPEYRIPDQFRSVESIMKFLTDHQIPSELSHYLLTFHDQDPVKSTLLHLPDGKNIPHRISKAVKKYPILKELTRGPEETRSLDQGRRKDFWPVLEIAMTIQDPDLQQLAIQKSAKIILEAEAKCDFLTILRGE